MEILVADGALVERPLPMNEAIEAMRASFLMLTAGGAETPLRMLMWLPHGGRFALVPSQLDGLDAVGVKVTGIFPPRGDRGHASYRGIVQKQYGGERARDRPSHRGPQPLALSDPRVRRQSGG